MIHPFRSTDALPASGLPVAMTDTTSPKPYRG